MEGTDLITNLASEAKLAEVWLRITAFLSLKTPKTQNTYAGIVSEWCEFLQARPNTAEGAAKLLAVNDLHGMAYINWLTKKPGHAPRLKSSGGETLLPAKEIKNKKSDGTQSTLSNSTIAKKVAALRRIYRMLIAADLGIAKNPFDRDKVQVPYAKSGQKRPTEMISFDKVKEIVNLPEKSTEKGIRDAAILAIMFGAGLRKSEVLNLKVGDVRYSGSGICYLRLRATKSKQDADQPLPKWAELHVKDQLISRKTNGAADGDYFITGFRGRDGLCRTNEPLSASGIHKIFKKYCTLAGASHYATPHSARATAITKLLTDGHDHKYVQKFSRHSSTQMVDVYDKRRLDIEDNPGLELEY